MKRFSPEQIQNMIFVVAVVAACAIIGVYLGSRRDDAPAAMATAMPTATAEEADAELPGVHADDVMQAFVAYGYLIEPSSDKGVDWVIEDVPELGDVYLSCTKEAKRVVSLRIRVGAYAFPTPQPGSAIEQALGEDKIVPAAYQDALALLLTAAAGALAEDGAGRADEALLWTDGAISALGAEKIFRHDGEDAVFTASLESGVQRDALLMTLTKSGA